MRLEKMVSMLVLAAAACGSPDASDTNGGGVDRPAPAAVAADGRAGGAAADPVPGGEPAPSTGVTEPTPASGPRAGPEGETTGPAARTPAAADPAPDPAPADAADRSGANAILERAEQAYAGVRSMRADFVQRVTVPLLGQSQQSAGRIYHRRPDRFLMDFSDPDGDVIVADGRYLWMYYPSTDARQVMRTTLDAAGGSVDLQREFLSDATSRYDATHTGVEQVDGRPADVLRLTPRESSQYRQVTIWVDKRDAMVRRFEIVEMNESVRRLELRNLAPNVEIEDRLFTFTPPPGAQVFDS